MSESFKSLGVLSEPVIKEFKKAKLMTVIRGGEVWIDDSDIKKAREIMASMDKAPAGKKENAFRFHGYVIKVPEHIKITQQYIGNSSERFGAVGNFAIIEFAKPWDGLDSSVNRKQISQLSITRNKQTTKIDLNVSSFVPAYSGIVMSDDNGVPIFEICGYNIFVLFDTRANPTATKQVYELMLIYAIMLADHGEPKSREVYDKIWQHQAKDREQYEIRQFRDMFAGGIKDEIAMLDRNIKQWDKEVLSLKTSLFNTIRSIEDNAIKLEALRTNGEKAIEKRATEEWERIKALERTGRVRNIRVSKERISFHTGMIKWTPKQKEYSASQPEGGGHVVAYQTDPIELGEYDVSLNITGGCQVSITNMTKVLSYEANRWHHPHVKEGNVCKGNMEDRIPQFAAKREFEAVIMCFLKWLENVDINDSWGRRIYYWIKDHNERASERKKREEEFRKAKEAEAEKARIEAEAKAKAEAEAAKPKEAPATAPVDVAGAEKRPVKFVME